MHKVSYVVCVTGASGFIGLHLLPLLMSPGVTLRVLSRAAEPNMDVSVETFIGDLFDKHSLVPFLNGANILINLAQPSGSLADDRFAEAMANLAWASQQAEIQRLLHISTAMVIGEPQGSHVDELSVGRPVTAYERQKMAAERILLETLGGQVDLGILRPTAVFGTGGKNLLKLSETITHASELQRRLLRFLHGNRRMHLVSVNDVVAAIAFLAFSERPLAGNVFLISSDDEPINNYQAVDAILGRAMGKPMPKHSISLPKGVLRMLLALAGRSQSDPQLFYDSGKLKSWGFQSSTDFESELQQFARGFLGGSRY